MHCLPIFSKECLLTMRKNLFTAACLFALSFTFIFSACKQGKPKEEQTLTNYELSMTDRDTLAVTSLVDRFFGYLENDKLTDALAMLYVADSNDRHAEPQLLDNEQLARLSQVYKSLMPIRSHKIEYIKFSQTYDNEVKVRVTLEEARDGQPAITTVIYFKPFDFLSDWRLCLMSSEQHNERIISNEQADSMQQRYSEELEQKSAK